MNTNKNTNNNKDNHDNHCELYLSGYIVTREMEKVRVKTKLEFDPLAFLLLTDDLAEQYKHENEDRILIASDSLYCKLDYVSEDEWKQ